MPKQQLNLTPKDAVKRIKTNTNKLATYIRKTETSTRDTDNSFSEIRRMLKIVETYVNVKSEDDAERERQRQGAEVANSEY